MNLRDIWHLAFGAASIPASLIAPNPKIIVADRIRESAPHHIEQARAVTAQALRIEKDGKAILDSMTQRIRGGA